MHDLVVHYVNFCLETGRVVQYCRVDSIGKCGRSIHSIRPNGLLYFLSIGKLRLISGTWKKCVFFLRASEKVCRFDRFVKWTALFSIRQVELSIGKFHLISGTLKTL